MALMMQPGMIRNLFQQATGGPAPATPAGLGGTMQVRPMLAPISSPTWGGAAAGMGTPVFGRPAPVTPSPMGGINGGASMSSGGFMGGNPIGGPAPNPSRDGGIPVYGRPAPVTPQGPQSLGYGQPGGYANMPRYNQFLQQLQQARMLRGR